MVVDITDSKNYNRWGEHVPDRFEPDTVVPDSIDIELVDEK